MESIFSIIIVEFKVVDYIEKSMMEDSVVFEYDTSEVGFRKYQCLGCLQSLIGMKMCLV